MMRVIAHLHGSEAMESFSVSQSMLEQVIRYVENQEEHHKKLTFKEEFRMFLKKYNVAYDEKYVWD